MTKEYDEAVKRNAQSQRAEQRATEAFTAEQDKRVHQGRKAGSFSAPLKKQSRDATGGYYKGDPFKGLKVR
jgi:hypothetical protein